MITVRAIEDGYYGESYRRKGSTFEIGDKEFTGKYTFRGKDMNGKAYEEVRDVRWPKWLEKIDGDEVEEDSDEDEAPKKKAKPKSFKKESTQDSVI